MLLLMVTTMTVLLLMILSAGTTCGHVDGGFFPL